MLRNFRVLILFALAALAWNVTPAYSTTLTTYTTVTSWQSATTVVDPTITFTNMVGDYTFTGLAAGNVDFFGYTPTGNSLQVLDTSTIPSANFGTGEALSQTEYSGYRIKVNFLSPVTAFGTNLFTYNPSSMPFTITLYGASTQLGTLNTAATNAPLTPSFWGVTSDTQIYSAEFTLGPSAGGAVAFLDNFTYGTADTQGPPPETPEAATMLLIGSGLVGLAILGKKMRPVQPA